MKKISIILVMLFWCNAAFAGCIQGNCKNGQGTYTKSDGSKYVGEWKDGKYHEKNKLKEEKKKEKKERIAKGKASCGDYIDMNWYSNSYGASFEFDNPSTETIRITRVAVKTKNKEIMLQEQHDLILEPFTKKNRIWIAKDNFMHELAKWGSYGCSFAPKGTKVKKSKNNQGTQSKKNGGKSLIEKIFGD